MHPLPAAEFFGLSDLAPVSGSSRSAESLEGFRLVSPLAPASACVPPRQPTAPGMISTPLGSPECSSESRHADSPADNAGLDCAFCMAPQEEFFGELPWKAEHEEVKPENTRAWHRDWGNALSSLRSSWDSSWDSCCPARPERTGRAHKT